MPLLLTSKTLFAVSLESIIPTEVKKTTLKRCSKKFKKHTPFFQMNRSVGNTIDLDIKDLVAVLRLEVSAVADLTSI